MCISTFCNSNQEEFIVDWLLFRCKQAVATQEANRAASNRMPPIWAIAAMVVLGWNEFFTALRNPLWLVAGVVLFLFFKVIALVDLQGVTCSSGCVLALLCAAGSHGTVCNLNHKLHMIAAPRAECSCQPSWSDVALLAA